MSQRNIKRKHETPGSSENVFVEDENEVSLAGLNLDEDGDSSDPEASDVDDDDHENKIQEPVFAPECDGEQEDIDERDGRDSDSIDEDDIEDVSSGDEDIPKDSDSEEDEDSDDEAIQNHSNGKVEKKCDSDSGVEDMSQERISSHGKTQIGKVKKKDPKEALKTLLMNVRGGVRKSEEDEEGGTSTGAERESRKNTAGEYDEYEEDSSDEEDLRNTIGNIPIKWYDEYPHLGYDLEGKEIIKPIKGDTLDELLNRLENPDYNRTVYDKQTGQNVRLSDADLDIVKRITSSRVPDGEVEMYPKWIDHFTHEVMEMPLSGRPEHKRSFLPSKHEAAFVAKRAEQIRRGLIKFSHRKRQAKMKQMGNYDLWSDNEKHRHIADHLKAPKIPLPGHGESFNPPVEYIKKGSKRYKTIRNVPGHSYFIKDRYERCLDLYIAPRKRILRVTASSKDILPVLPKPKDLQPFPSREALIFKGHRSIIRSISVHPLGKYLASGSDDHTVRIWEISTGRCLRSYDVDGAVKCVAWNPSVKLFLLAVVANKNVYFINPETYLTDKLVVQQTNAVFRDEPDQGDFMQAERVRTAVTWRKPTADEWAKGYRIVLEHFRMVKQIVWHKQGDYFATVIPEGDHRSVMMHQLSRWRSQVPFNKCKGRVQCVQFHPKLPFLYVASQTHVRVYNLQKQRLLKKVQSNCRWISSIAIHPGGEHFLVGGYDRKVNWFEMEYTRRPLVLRYHREAVRSVAYHRKYPLFASASDEGRVIVSHGMVFNDWLKDPFLVPVKELRGHFKFQDMCVLDLAWHPYEPFLFTSGADATIRLWH